MQRSDDQSPTKMAFAPNPYGTNVLPSYGAGSYAPYAPSVVPTVAPMYPQHFGGSVGPLSSYAGSMYSPDEDYYYGSRAGSYHGHPGYQGYPGSRSYMGSYHDYDYDDDYYGDSYSYDRYRDPYHSSRYRHRSPHYGRGRHYYDSYSSYYSPKAYQITRDGGIKTLRYGHEHFKDKLRRLCGIDPRGLKVRRH